MATDFVTDLTDVWQRILQMVRNRVFFSILVDNLESRKKPGFLGVVNQSETGFFSAFDKNPVSWA
ncbi:MAG: hypothetical protein EAZ09_07395 [Oscillatoriales cyanobacterium]|nr:MAG: hypothetical protein EAZ09_07395 [Oscillatoriales cyanobacterium]